MAELLVANGVDLNSTDGTWGGTALHTAAREGHRDIAALLRKHGGKRGKQLEGEKQRQK